MTDKHVELDSSRNVDCAQDNGTATVRFWGVHGTLPVPGKHTIRYGGNTSCVSVELADNRLLVFDAGSGIKNLSDYVLGKPLGPKPITVFISHPHWDHINALPFFGPLYSSQYAVEICGPSQGESDIEALVSAQMDSIFFPITIDEFCAQITFTPLAEGQYPFGSAVVQTMRLTHPGYCLGYRLRLGERSLCYLTDNELYPRTSPAYSAAQRQQLIEFTRGADILIIDSTYFDHEYLLKANWGHSCLSEVAEFAHQAEVQQLCLFHHDVAHSDDDIDRKLAFVRHWLASNGSKTHCVAPCEGDTLHL